MAERLAVIGSRGFSNAALMAEKLEPYRAECRQIVSGGARGADRLAERWARKNGIEPKVFYPDHKRYRHAHHHRNRLIAENCDLLIAFWDGSSTGTRYTINYARRLGKPIVVVRY